MSPCLEIRPLRLISPDSYRRGVKPRYAPAPEDPTPSLVSWLDATMAWLLRSHAPSKIYLLEPIDALMVPPVDENCPHANPGAMLAIAVGT